ncbi:MAG: tRNA (adenosine(37)-N6)-threonylcarbamoyltransferase complex ATPase subunit type 1 TsaE [Planctomycetota bacterium]
MPELRLTTDSPQATERFGGALEALLEPGDIIALHGELGAGKTALARGIAQGLGIDSAIVSSPTFVLVNEYPASPPSRAQALVHIDAYRLGGSDDLDALGWDQLADGSAIVLIEWADRLAGEVEFAAEITLQHAGETTRNIAVQANDAIAARTAWRDLADQHTQAHTDEPARTPTTCPITGRAVPADSPTWPFADEKARMADLYRWMTDSYEISRPIEQRDLEEGLDA